jgi:hypothetical protein
MTGVAPEVILDDDLLYAAFRAEAEQASWTDLHELMAMNVEMTHRLWRQALASAGAKEADIPPVLRVPRPSDPKPRKIGAVEAARAMMGGK